MATSLRPATWLAMIDGVEWQVAPGLVPYDVALRDMERRVADIQAGEAHERVWLLEHPPLFTAGTSADPVELMNPQGFPVHDAGRGGRYTYHGPGQRVGYLNLDLGKRGKDIRCFVHELEGWMIEALERVGVSARREAGRIGIWTGQGAEEAKIGAIGVRVKRWVTLHGFSINVDPDLSHFGGIIPCGIEEFGVTSLKALGIDAGMDGMDAALKKTFPAFLQRLKKD